MEVMVWVAKDMGESRLAKKCMIPLYCMLLYSYGYGRSKVSQQASAAAAKTDALQLQHIDIEQGLDDLLSDCSTCT